MAFYRLVMVFFIVSCVYCSREKKSLYKVDYLTTYTTATVTTVVTKPSLCIGTGNVSNPLTVCRRRRAMEEIPEVSPPLVVLPTANPVVEPSFAPLEPSFNRLTRNLPPTLREPRSGLTFFLTKTLTANVTATATTYSGSQTLFTVVGCYPTQWASSICKP